MDKIMEFKTYKTKPMTISALEITTENIDELVYYNEIKQEFTIDKYCKVNDFNAIQRKLWVHTISGLSSCEIGDYLIQEMDSDNCYPCKREVFLAKYE